MNEQELLSAVCRLMGLCQIYREDWSEDDNNFYRTIQKYVLKEKERLGAGQRQETSGDAVKNITEV